MMDNCIAESLKDLLPKHPAKRYAPIGACIYCGNAQDLSDEHIIPLGLGGKWILPKSSCNSCSTKTSLFEMTCLRTMYGPLRQLYDLPSRKKNQQPKKLSLKVKYRPTDEWMSTLVDQKDYPFLVTFPYFSMPDLITGKENIKRRGATTDRLWIRGASAYSNFHKHMASLLSKLKAYSIFPDSVAHIPEFCQMLAKVAHSYAVAELGHGKFEPFLLRHITHKELSDCASFIGSLDEDEKPSNNIHELSICRDAKGYIVVRVRFLAKLGTPTYYAVVGK